MITLVSVLLMIVGAVVYLIAANAKVAELGRVMFAAGAFALAFSISGYSVGIK